MMRSGIIATALVLGLVGCNSGGESGNMAVAPGTYHLSFENGDCGLLKTSNPMRYESDGECDGSVDYTNTNVTRIGNRYFVEAASMEVTAVSEDGFEGIFSLRGNPIPFTATLRTGES